MKIPLLNSLHQAVQKGCFFMRSRLHRFDRGIGVVLAIAWVAFLLVAWKYWFVAPKKSDSSPVVPQQATAASSPRPVNITVYVIGAVKHPGLYHLPLDSRLNRAIQAAGGATASADLLAVNLAAVAEDGTEIVVPDKNGQSAQSPSTVANTQGTAKAVPNGVRIPINQAGLATLETLPGIGVKKAQAIMDYRRAHGLFTSVNQLSEVKGIGPKLLAKILPQISLH